MASFYLIGAIYLHSSCVISIANLFHCKLNATNFENVLLLNLVVDFFVVVLQTSHNQVHIFVEIRETECGLAG